MKVAIILFFLLVASIPLCVPVVNAAEIDAVTVCDWVIDGDTFDTTSGERIRLADIDAPESGEAGYSAAKNALIDLIYDKTVYLDIDDIYETDPYGRLVCVVYVKYSSTYYKNVNKALLDEGVAIISDYYNEFNPYSWTLYVHEDDIPEFPTLIMLPLFMISTILVAILYRRKRATHVKTLLKARA